MGGTGSSEESWEVYGGSEVPCKIMGAPQEVLMWLRRTTGTPPGGAGLRDRGNTAASSGRGAREPAKGLREALPRAAGIAGAKGGVAELPRWITGVSAQNPRGGGGRRGRGKGRDSAGPQALTSAHAWLSGAGPYSSVANISRARDSARVAAITRPDRFPPTAGRSTQGNLEVRRAGPPPPAQRAGRRR